MNELRAAITNPEAALASAWEMLLDAKWAYKEHLRDLCRQHGVEVEVPAAEDVWFDDKGGVALLRADVRVPGEGPEHKRATKALATALTEQGFTVRFAHQHDGLTVGQLYWRKQ